MDFLSEDETFILSLVKEYLNKNREFNKNKILTYLNYHIRLSKRNINSDGVFKIIKSLIDKNFLVEGSKLSKTDILLNNKRLAIYNYINKNPGTYYNKILKDLDYNNNVVIWHLEMLIKFNYIKKFKFMNKHLYCESNCEFKDAKISYITSKNSSKKIINYLKNKEEGANKTKITSKLNMHYNTVSKYIDLLEEFNIIIKIDSKKNIYSIKKP
ncbi:MAG: hypothetical protein ACFFDF_00080 [Candidatus Odinarchaeota archaeon]